MIEIAQLNVFPVKSLRGIALEHTRLDVRGLAFDRHWMVTDDSGRFVTQRELPAMATITVRLSPQALMLEHASASPLVVDLAPTSESRVEVVVWQDRCLATDEGDAASHWLTGVLGAWRGGPLRLVRFAEEHRRSVDARHLRGEQSHTAFADGFPFLVTSERSLDALNRRLVAQGLERVTMDRFRPNIVVRGLAAFEEDRLDRLQRADGAYDLGLRKPCSRCAITTTDQATGEIVNAREPLRTLMAMKTQPELPGAYFGQNASLLAGEGETIAVGDTLIAR